MKKTKRSLALALAVLTLLSIMILPVGASAKERPCVWVGGIPFGVRFFTEGILVVGYCDVQCGGACHNPARAAGLAPGDCIYQINEETPHTANELTEMLMQVVDDIRLVYPATMTIRSSR